MSLRGLPVSTPPVLGLYICTTIPHFSTWVHPAFLPGFWGLNLGLCVGVVGALSTVSSPQLLEQTFLMLFPSYVVVSLGLLPPPFNQIKSPLTNSCSIKGLSFRDYQGFLGSPVKTPEPSWIQDVRESVCCSDHCSDTMDQERFQLLS